MKAALITRFGDPDVLDVREIADPQPGPRQVLIRVRASALNRADVLQRMGRYPPPNDAPRDIPGIEFAGEVVALGAGTTRWHEGDRVFALTGGGAHAELVIAHEDTLSPIPANLEWTAAGAVPEAFITAHDALITQAGLREGERLLVHAVGSGVGLAAVQIARAVGAIAFGTSRTADKLQKAADYGLSEGVVPGRELEGLAAAVADWTDGRGFDVILDLVGGPYVAASVDSAAVKGRIMLVGAIGGAQASIDVRRILGKRLTLRGTVLRARALEEKIEVARAFERDLIGPLANAEVRPVIDSIFPLERIADAHRRMESNETFGKVVIEC